MDEPIGKENLLSFRQYILSRNIKTKFHNAYTCHTPNFCADLITTVYVIIPSIVWRNGCVLKKPQTILIFCMFGDLLIQEARYTVGSAGTLITPVSCTFPLHIWIRHASVYIAYIKSSVKGLYMCVYIYIYIYMQRFFSYNVSNEWRKNFIVDCLFT